jgi:hypothetical protein
MFGITNYLQYALQKPWRSFLKKPNGLNHFFNTYFFFIGFFYRIGSYLILSPLRFFNAIYYNLWIYGLWNIRDNVSDIFKPKTGYIARQKGFVFLFLYLVQLPYRIVKYAGVGIIQLFEGCVFVVVDTLIPALTLYHGTTKEASISISKPGEWKVGGGNFAGSGIYFGANKGVAKNYSGTSSDSVIIAARVSLGSCKNLSLAPKHIYKLIGNGCANGERITDWALNKGYNSIEWWRENRSWWEYCLLNKHYGKFVKHWRIRILYIENANTHAKERIWGGKALWLF